MKRLLLASLAGLALTSGSALAADLYRPAPAYKAPPPPPPAYSWTGCYIDGNVGYGLWKQDHNSETVPGLTPKTVTLTSGGEGWLGRVGGGCDYQVASRFVVGAFGDFDFMNIHGNFHDHMADGQGDENESSAWAVGGRIGYLVTPALLTYFDGGYTEARFDQIDLSTPFIPSKPLGADIPSQTYHGWFIGGGTEYALGSIVPIPGLFWRSEYRFASYRAADVPVVMTATGAPFVMPGVGPLGDHVQKDVQTITTGLVWRFNFGGPIATRD